MFHALRESYSRLTAVLNRIADSFEAFADHIDPPNAALTQPPKRIKGEK